MSFFKKIFTKKKAKNQLNFDSFSSVILVLQTQIDEFCMGIEKMQAQYNTNEVPIIFDSFIFFRITLIDILGIVNQYRSTNDENEKKITIRNLALHLYEFLDDSKDFFGNRMRNSIKNNPNELELISDINKIKSYLKALNNIMGKPLADIRNHTAAHKEQRALILRKKINEIDYGSIMNYSIICIMFLMMIIQFQNNLINSLQNKLNESNPEFLQLKLRKVENVFLEFILKIRGTESNLARAISDMTTEERQRTIKTIESIQEYLNQKK